MKHSEELTPDALRLLVHVSRTALFGKCALSTTTPAARKAKSFLLRHDLLERERVLGPGGQRIVWRYGITKQGREKLKERP
ncbi:MAG: hypothetical protein EHM84_02090 [Lysobacterales bacterium]|nr:MAG: hypothetical protein EHM84_02090 [Xanthomonadales bacterium]